MSAPIVNAVPLPSGEQVPALGLGTWCMGEDPAAWEIELSALRTGLDLGMTLIDTAEMYGNGGAERLVGEAIAGRRDDVFLVSKVLPSNASRRRMRAACEASLKRLGTDRIDLYLLHWRGATPLAETVECFQSLREAGKIRYWGVSNFDVSDIEELLRLDGSVGAHGVQTNQVLYNLTRRGIEFDLLPWCQEQLRVPLMAYSPIERGALLSHPALEQVAAAHGASAVQVAIAWVLRQPGVIAIPKASTPEHVRENHAALSVQLTQADLAALDRAFPPPKRAAPLEML